MGRLASLIAFTRASAGDSNTSDVKVDRGGNDNRTPQHFSPPGDDSFPLPGDYVHLGSQAGTGRDSAIGYVDPKNSQKSNSGDKRIYARNSSSGEQIVEIWLKNDGAAEINNDVGMFVVRPDGSIKGSNSNGNFELQSGGDFVVNNVTIKANGDVIMPNSLMLNGKEIDGHNHSQGNDSGGNAEQDTGPNN